jgi:hypothetical protein
MATDMTAVKSKKRRNLGAPPRAPLAVEPAAPKEDEDSVGLVDMRMMMRSARTVQFNTKIKPSTARRINQMAIRQQVRIVELFERMVDLYEAHLQAGEE